MYVRSIVTSLTTDSFVSQGLLKEPDLRKAAHEMSQSLWVWTLKLLDNLKALV